ncbi:homocysteine S-methyltransferase family protein [Rhizobium sp. FKL33]|uniref:homocysteine S-methyltransferase family protein n=1 Tax=Rhizobium sp. FKL33 TaxID=2562307 RepID=UPI0010BF9216|nr:homocysteine S-methyltransferase family protein [Rhizobium sp. FKL33]
MTATAQKKTRILDGGMSRELVRLGAELKQPEWSALALMNAPDIVRKVHEEFIEAGAEVITTNSYALVPFHIGEEKFRADGAALIALAGRLAREAADGVGQGKTLVAGSLPPIFGSYEPQLFDASRVQDYLHVLVTYLAPYVDLWLGETLSLIAEGEAVREAIKDTGKPFWISFTLDDTDLAIAQGAVWLRSGESVTAAAEWAASSGASALLFNCAKPEVMGRAVDAAKAVFDARGVDIEIGVYANAFENLNDGEAANEGLHGTRDDLNSDKYSTFAAEWVEKGASLVGGCCGIGAEHICRVANRLKA